jgi:hypothetical protein
MKTAIVVVGTLSLCLAGCGEKSNQSAQTTNTSSGPSPLSAPADYLGAIGAAKTLAEKTVDLAQINQAIQMFQADKGRYPKDLDELVRERLLVQVPKAPYGRKIVYDAATGKVTILKE